MSGAKEKPKPWREWRADSRPRWMRPFLWTECGCEWLAYYFSRWAFFEVLEYVAKFGLVVTAITWLFGWKDRQRASDDQRKAKHYQAWQAINSAYGKQGDAGRSAALYDLKKDGVSLAGVNISGAFLLDVELSRASMQYARLTNGTYVRADFRGTLLWRAQLQDSYFGDGRFDSANLEAANLSRSRLELASFHEAMLSEARLVDAYLVSANLQGAYLGHANLSGALATGADLTDAILTQAELKDMDFTRANLTRTKLDSANLDSADFKKALLIETDFLNVRNWTNVVDLQSANLFGIRNAPEGFLEWATNQMGAVVVPVSSYGDWTNWLSQNAKKPAR